MVKIKRYTDEDLKSSKDRIEEFIADFPFFTEKEKGMKAKKIISSSVDITEEIVELLSKYSIGSDMIAYNMSSILSSVSSSSLILKSLDLKPSKVYKSFIEDALSYKEATGIFELMSSLSVLYEIINISDYSLFRSFASSEIQEKIIDSHFSTFDDTELDELGLKGDCDIYTLLADVLPSLIEKNHLEVEDIDEYVLYFRDLYKGFLKRRIALEARIQEQEYLLQDKSLLGHIRAYCSPISAMSAGKDEWAREMMCLDKDIFHKFMNDENGLPRSADTVLSFAQFMKSLQETSDFTNIATYSQFILENHLSLDSLHPSELIVSSASHSLDPRLYDFIALSSSYEQRDKIDDKIKGFSKAFLKLNVDKIEDLFRKREAKASVYALSYGTDFNEKSLVSIFNFIKEYIDELEENDGSDRLSLAEVMVIVDMYKADNDRKKALKTIKGSLPFIRSLVESPEGYVAGTLTAVKKEATDTGLQD